MRLPTRGRGFLPLLMILTSLLAACAPNEAILPQAVGAVLSAKTPAARKAALRRQLAAICPTPLSDDELEWAAQFVELNRSQGAAWIAGRLLKMHREAKICRGVK